MTEPTEADFAAYDAALERAHLAYCDQTTEDPDFKGIDELCRREFAQAIAEARAQGRRAAIEAAATIVRQHPFAEDASEGCADAQGCCEMMEAQVRALLDEGNL